jgi:AraC-like DNA-binding protein
MSGVEIRFKPLGAHMFLGVSMAEMTNRVVAFEDVLGRAGRIVTERLHEAQSWEARFAILDAAIERRLAAARRPSPSVRWAWQRLSECGGRTPVGELAAELGCSRKHLASGFREQIGLSPKTFARILRFRRATRLLARADVRRWGEIAFHCGYYDQAHFNRDFKEFAGSTPTEFLGQPELNMLRSLAAD